MEPRVNLLCLPTVDSTNVYALAHADELPDLTLVCADEQTAGRGRLNRRWCSPPGENLYATWLLKNWTHPPFQAMWLVSAAVMAACAACAPQCWIWVKWPNDLMIGTRKLCGMLAECRYQGGAPLLALGFGLNLNMEESALKEVGQPATSLFFETKMKINRDFFHKSLENSLNTVYINSTRYGVAPFFESWRSANGLIGQSVRFADPAGRIYAGTVRDVTFEGELLLETSGGVQAFSCGDVSLCKDSFSPPETL